MKIDEESRRTAFDLTNVVNRERISVLNEFKPILCILQAYSSVNFRSHNGRHCLRRGALCALCASEIHLIIPTVGVLIMWYLVDNYGNLLVVISALPMLLSLIQNNVVFVTLTVNNRLISQMIGRVQQVINHRKDYE